MLFRQSLKSATNPRFVESVRRVSTSVTCHGRAHFRNMFWDKRGSTRFLEMRKTTKDPVLMGHDYGVRHPGIKRDDGTLDVIPEMVPELIVPDLTGFKLKPYVSYCAPEAQRAEYTAQDLFKAIYQDKIVADFKEGNLLEDGSPKSPSAEEKFSAEAAVTVARQTGSDIFAEDPKEPIPMEIFKTRH